MINPNQFPDSNEESSEPYIHIDIEDLDAYGLKLTWHNTLYWQFMVGEGTFDFVMTYSDDNLYIYTPNEELKNFLTENFYPNRIDPIVNEEAEEYIFKLELGNL